MLSLGSVSSRSQYPLDFSGVIITQRRGEHHGHSVEPVIDRYPTGMRGTTKVKAMKFPTCSAVHKVNFVHLNGYAFTLQFLLWSSCEITYIDQLQIHSRMYGSIHRNLTIALWLKICVLAMCATVRVISLMNHIIYLGDKAICKEIQQLSTHAHNINQFGRKSCSIV